MAVSMYHAYSRTPIIVTNLAHAQHCGMTLYPGMLVCFSTNHSLHFASEQDTSGLHCEHEVANLYLLHFTVDKDFVLMVLTVVEVLSFAQLSQYANARDNIIVNILIVIIL